MAGSLGESLSVVIGANADPLVQELNKAASAVNSWGSGVKDSLEKVSTAAELMNGVLAGAVGGEIGELSKSLLENASSIYEQSEALGLSTGKFQELQYAAQQAGVDVDKFTTGMDKLSKIFGEAMVGNGGEALKTLENWGIVSSQAELKTMTFEQVLERVEDRFATITDPQLKAAAASDLMGRNMLLLANFFSQGSEKIDEFGQKAEAAGAVMDKETIEKAHEATIEFENMVTVLKADLLPVVEALITPIKALGEAIGSVFKGFNGGASKTLFDPNASSDQITSQINQLKKQRDDLTQTGGFGSNLDIQNDTQLIDELQKKLEQVQKTSSASAASPSSSGGGFQPLGLDNSKEVQAQKDADAYDKAEDKIDDYINHLKLETAELGKNDAERNLHHNLMEAEQIAESNGVQLSQQQIQQITNESAAWSALNKQLEAQRQDAEQAKQFANQLASGLTSAFEEAAVSAEPLHQVFLGLIQDIEKMILRAEVLKPLANFITGANGEGGGSGVSILSRLASYIPGFASGTDDMSGAAIVGERGPELWVPPTAGGSIVPNSAIGRGSGGGGFSPSMQMNVTVSGPAAGDPKTAANAGAAFAQAAKAQFTEWLQQQTRIGGVLWGKS